MSQIQPSELSPTLLRRIAHAVDGFRSGHLVYVVVDIKPPYKVRKMIRKKQPDKPGGFDDPEAEAERLCQAYGGTYKWAGPYQTFAGEDDPFTIECHEFDSDPCADGEVTGRTINPPSSPLPKPTDVEEITVSWKTKDPALSGRKIFRWEELCTEEYLAEQTPEYRRDLVKHMVDSLFFTQAASDRFLIPYIAHVHGVRAAYEYRTRMDLAVKEAFKNKSDDGTVPVRKVNKRNRSLGRAVLVDKHDKIVPGTDS